MTRYSVSVITMSARITDKISVEIWAVIAVLRPTPRSCRGNLVSSSSTFSIIAEPLDSPSASPSCFSYAMSRSLGDISTEYSLACGKSSGKVLALMTTSGQSAATGAGTAIQSFAQESANGGRSSYEMYESGRGWDEANTNQHASGNLFTKKSNPFEYKTACLCRRY